MFDHNGEPVPTWRDTVRRWFARNVGMLVASPILVAGTVGILRLVWP